MASFLERLRAALAYRYDVDHEIASGGMGTVFLGRHRPLDKAVAIKALRDDVYSYTAVTEERFIREAKTLALFSHPNIVTVHDVDKRGGIPFYVMDYLAGETLADRVERAPLSPEAAGQLGLDLLAALGAAHAKGVIHRDVKPSNIMFQDGRAMLVDFGIAKRVTADPVTGHGERPGTVSWMPPEQLAGAELTPRADLYSAAMVLYHALTGVMWSVTDRVKTADWSDVPKRLRPVLMRALCFDARDRWADAAEFRTAWQRAIGPRPVVALSVAAIVGVVVLAVIILIVKPAAAIPRADVLVAPFAGASVADQNAGKEVARFATYALQAFQPEHTVLDSRSAFSCWDGALAEHKTPRRACGHARAHAVVEGQVTSRDGSVDVQLTVFNGDDESVIRSPRVSGPADSVDALARRTATAVVRALGWGDTAAVTYCGANPAALAAFNRGEDAFAVDDWLFADQQYQQAFALDSTCALGAWRLSVVRAWRRAPVGLDLQRLYDRSAGRLPPVERALLRATLTPSGPDRLALFDSALTLDSSDSYAWLLRGNELWSRGALSGVSPDAANTVLREAAHIDASVPAYDHIAWLNIRRGDRKGARAALDAIRRRPAPRGDVDLPRLLELAYALRFAPESAQIDTTQAGALNDIAQAVRFGLTVDVPEGQVLFGAMLTTAPGMTNDQRADGHEAQGVALIMMGRTVAALAQLDSAAALRGPAARIEPAEWRLLLGGLGLLTPADTEVTTAHRVLQRLVSDPVLGGRATWDLAVSAYAVGDTTAGGRTMRAFRPRDPQDTIALRALLALQLAARGRLADAAAAARPLGWTDADHLRRYPFLRSVVHLRQGAWLAQLGDTAAADSAWLWYDNADAAQWPIGPAQAGDVDWALAAWARLLRARLDPTRRACGAKRAAELWAGADASYRALVAEARTLARRCRS